MSTSSSSINLLRNTTYLMSLARRAALDSADATQRQHAIQLGPVLSELRGLARTEESLQPGKQSGAENSDQQNAQSPNGVLARGDFQTLLAASRQERTTLSGAPEAPLDRTNVALGMAKGGASELEIARALGYSQGEVDLILQVAKHQT